MIARQSVYRLLSCALILCVLASCTLGAKRPTDPRPPLEQLLISKALKRSIEKADIGIPEGTAIHLEVSGLTIDQSGAGTVTQRHVRQVLAGWLGNHGLIVRETDKEASLLVRVLIQSLGTITRTRFVGLPESKSFFLPIGLPELSLWKRQTMQGYARYYMDIFEVGTDRYVRSTRPIEGSVTQERVTAFLFFRWQDTDLDLPLELF